MGGGGRGLALSTGSLILGALLLAGAAVAKEPRPGSEPVRSRSVSTLGPVVRIGETARFQIGYRRFEAGPACTALRQGTVVRFVWGRACPARLLIGSRQQVCDVICTYWNPIETRYTGFMPPWALRHAAGDPPPEPLGTTFVPGSRLNRPAQRMRMRPPPTPPPATPAPATKPGSTPRLLPNRDAPPPGVLPNRIAPTPGAAPRRSPRPRPQPQPQSPVPPPAPSAPPQSAP